MSRRRQYHPVSNERVCLGCKQTLHVTQFDFVPSIGIYRARCRECLRSESSDRKRAIYASNPAQMLRANKEYRELNKKKFRNYDLRRYFGITEEEFEAMLAEQGGRCKICGTTEPAGKHKRFHVDHEHKDGSDAGKRRKGIRFAAENRRAIRGILCQHCNVGLGMLKDDPEVLRAAAEYLERHKAKQTA